MSTESGQAQVAIYGQLVSAMKTINQYVLHRDLKPANIFYGDTTIRVGDFGLAKYVDEATRSKTFKGWGTTPYMAPELWIGTSVDWRADQYALGVVFFELATFSRPFVGPPEDLKRSHLYVQAPRANALAPHLPPRLTTLIAKMLEKRREDRFQTWDEVAREVAALSESFAAPPQNEARDPIAAMLVKNLDVHRQQQLEAQKEEDERTRQRQQRQGIIVYWWEKFCDPLRLRLERLNQETGGQTIKYTVKGHRLEASLFNSRLTFELEDIPPDPSREATGWGLLRTTTPKSVCVSQLLLIQDPEPYGHWVDVYMEVHPLIQRNIRPADLAREAGGRYEIVGDKRLVIALGYAGVLEQRAIRNMLSLVQYREQAFDFDKSMEECLKYFVQDAHAPRASDQF